VAIFRARPFLRGNTPNSHVDFMPRTIALARDLFPQLRSHKRVHNQTLWGSDMEISAKLQLLKQTPYFASLPLSEIRELVPRLLERHYRAGDLIFRKGDRSEGLCVVLSGRVRTETTSEEGREQVLKVFGPGRTFADIPAFDGEPQPANAIAVSDSTVALLRRTDLLDLVRRHPDVGLDVIRLFASRLRAYKVMVEDLSLRDVVSRVARLLHDRARGQTTLSTRSASGSILSTPSLLLERGRPRDCSVPAAIGLSSQLQPALARHAPVPLP